VPQQVPQLAMGNAVPQQVPQATPQRVPMAVPNAVPHLVPRPRPRPVRTVDTVTRVVTPVQITHRETPTVASVGQNLVTSRPGRQPLHAPPAFAAGDGDSQWHCMASGHGKRRGVNGEEVEVAGTFVHAGFVESLARDVPARHPKHAECMISIRRKQR